MYFNESQLCMETVLDELMENAPVSIVMFDKQMNIVAATQKWLSDYGFSRKDVIGKNRYDLSPVVPERWKDVHKRCLGGASEKNDRDIIYHKDGHMDYVRWEIKPWRNKLGDILGVVMYTELITEKVLAEDKILRLNNELNLLNSIHEICGKAVDDFDLADQVCKAVIDIGKYQLVWFGYKPGPRNESGLIYPLHKYGEAIHYLHDLVIDTNNPGHRRGPAVTALQTGKTVIVNDFQHDPDYAPWVKNAREHQLNASISIPMKLTNGKEALMAIYSRHTGAFQDHEAGTLERMANQLVRTMNSLHTKFLNKVGLIKQENYIREINNRNRNLEQFTYLVSHDFRSRVANFLGISELFSHSGLDETEQAELIEAVRVNALKLDETMRDLNRSLLVKNHLILNDEPILFSELMECTLQKIRMKFNGFDIEILVDKDEARQFNSDGYYLHELLYQLCSSILKMETRELSLVASIKRDADKICLELTDRCLHTLEQPADENIFSVYSRLYRHLSDGEIKFFYANAILENLGGRLSIRVNENKQALFIIELPVS